MKIEARKVNILNRIHVLDSFFAPLSSHTLFPSFSYFAVLSALFRLPPLNYVCMRFKVYFSLGRRWRRQAISFHLIFQIQWCDMCVSASVRFYYETNHGALWDSLLLFHWVWVCVCVCLSCSYLTSSIHIYIPQVFFKWYILSITILNISLHRKRKRLESLAKCLILSFGFVSLPDRCYWYYCRFIFLISKSNTHVYICVRIRKIFASLRLSLYFGSFFSLLDTSTIYLSIYIYIPDI